MRQGARVGDFYVFVRFVAISYPLLLSRLIFVHFKIIIRVHPRLVGDPPPGVAGRNVPPPFILVPAKPDLFAFLAILARGFC